MLFGVWLEVLVTLQAHFSSIHGRDGGSLLGGGVGGVGGAGGANIAIWGLWCNFSHDPMTP